MDRGGGMNTIKEGTLLPMLTLVSMFGSRAINWQGDLVGSDNIREYKRIRHRSQGKKRRLARGRS